MVIRFFLLKYLLCDKKLIETSLIKPYKQNTFLFKTKINFFFDVIIKGLNFSLLLMKYTFILSGSYEEELDFIDITGYN